MGSITMNAVSRASNNWCNGTHRKSTHHNTNVYRKNSDWHTIGFVGVEGKGDIRPYTVGNFTVKNPTDNIDTTNDRYGANVVFGVDFVHGKCLNSDPRLTLGFLTRLGTDAEFEVHGDLKTTQHIIKSGFAITSETSVRAAGGLNWQEAMKRSDEHSGCLKYEGDIKTGPLLRWDRHLNKVPVMVELRPYVGAGFTGKSVHDQSGKEPAQTKIDVQALGGAETTIRFIDNKFPGLFGGYMKADINNKGGSIGVGYAF